VGKLPGRATTRAVTHVVDDLQHTVARHAQNILAKLQAPSRTAAVELAFEHDLV
jgi:ATP/maltotriose-dependent transcriptional regulator MalT